MSQEQYWKEMYQLKSHINFIELQVKKSEKLDRSIKMILAISSSSSISAWAIWHQFSWIWALIIAISQVISTIKTFLPYKSRVKSYSSLLIDLEQIFLKAEYKWHDISEGLLTSSEINELRFEIRKDKLASLNKYIKTSIPANKKMQSSAEESAKNYFSIFYT